MQGLFLPKFCEHDMKTLIKRIVIHMYCRDLVAGATVVRLFDRYKLWRV